MDERTIESDCWVFSKKLFSTFFRGQSGASLRKDQERCPWQEERIYIRLEKNNPGKDILWTVRVDGDMWATCSRAVWCAIALKYDSRQTSVVWSLSREIHPRHRLPTSRSSPASERKI